MLERIWRLARPWVEFWNELLGDPLKWNKKPERPRAAPVRPETAPVMVYVEWDSPGSAEIEKLLTERGMAYKVLPIDRDEATRSWLEATVKREPPVVFVGGELVGGLEDLKRFLAPRESKQPVVVYGRKTDPWTNRVTDLLDGKQVRYHFVDLDDPKHAGQAERLVADTKQNLTPYVFIRDQYVGGFNAVDELERLGQLDDRIAGRDPNSAAPGRPRIVIEMSDRPPGEPN